MDRGKLENLLRLQMPLAKAMDVRVLTANETEMKLTCLLSANHNHLGTAFGGSLSAMMILAAYCRLFYLMDGDGHVVLKKSFTQFMKPVKEDIVAICLPPTAVAVEEFMRIYQKKGRARLQLLSEIRLKDGNLAARMESEFVGLEK